MNRLLNTKIYHNCDKVFAKFIYSRLLEIHPNVVEGQAEKTDQCGILSNIAFSIKIIGGYTSLLSEADCDDKPRVE